MILRKLRAIHKSQRGFTLVELVIALAISGLITSGLTMTIFQVFNINTISGNQMIVVRQVQNAGYWISRDAQMAQSTTITGITGFPIILEWTDYVSGDNHQVVYNLSVDNEIIRTHFINSVLNATTFIARNIDLAMTNSETRGSGSFSLPDSTLNVEDQFTITDAVGGDEGTISVATPGDMVKATPYGGATLGTPPNDTDEVPINWGNNDVAWATPVPGSYIVVISNAENTTGSWTSTSGNSTATVTIDTNGDATFSDSSGLVLTVTATVGTASETRTYEIAPRPS